MAKKSISIKWFPPAWFQIKTQDKIIYIDPAWIRTHFINYPPRVEFSRWPEPTDGLPEKDLEKADLILITHHHKDHCKKVTVERLKHKATLIIAPERCCEELGKNVKVVKPGQEIAWGAIKIKTVDAYNTPEGCSTRKVHKQGECVGYLLTINGKNIYHAGDTDFIPEMKEIRNLDVALLPIGGTFTMNIEEAVKAAITIKPKVVIPMHIMQTDPQEFKKKAEAKPEIKVAILKTGKVYEILPQ